MQQEGCWSDVMDAFEDESVMVDGFQNQKEQPCSHGNNPEIPSVVRR